MKIKPNHPTREQLYQAYIVERKSIPLLVGEFHLAPETLKALIEHYGILKTPEQTKADANYRRLLAFKENKRSYAYQCSVVTKEILYKYYIEEDHGYYETLEHFDITEDTFRRMLKDYGIPQKDKSKTCQKGVATKYEKAGGKEAYYKQLKETTDERVIEKYGSLEAYGKIVSDSVKKAFQENNSIAKRYETLKKTKRFTKSKQEDDTYDYLLQFYNAEDVIRNYKCDKYPFMCDFYIKSLDLYIECNYHWSHGNEPFVGKESQLKVLEDWKSKNYVQHKHAYKIWSEVDPSKIECAKNNNLTYLMLYDIRDIKILEELNKLQKGCQYVGINEKLYTFEDFVRL